MKVFDCVTFFNEVDLLEFRIRLLSDVVDKFVICESNLTHSGKTKPFYFAGNFARFEQWKDRIIYFPIEQSTEGLTFTEAKSYTPTNGSWVLENQQRQALNYANDMVDDSDMVIISDMDEIPNPTIIKALKDANALKEHSTISLSMLFHYYYMNCQNMGFERWWNGSIVTTGNNFKVSTPQVLRDIRNNHPTLPEAGWHFSYLGGLDRIKKKIESFAHTEFNTPEIKAEQNILEALSTGKDIFNRPGVSYKFVGLDQYPEFLRDLMLQYPQFIKDVTK